MRVTGTEPTPPAIVALLADPLRWRLITELACSDLRVSELTSLTGARQSLVSYHLSELRNAGVVTARRSSADGRDTYYRADLVRCRALLLDVGAALHPGLEMTPLPARVPADTATHRVRRKPRVLFLCTGNSARSQMAEALMRDRTRDAVDVHSAGSHPKPLHPNAVRVMAARGIDIAGKPSTDLRHYARTRLDHVITLCDRVREICPEFSGAPATAHWSIPDPAAVGDDDASYAAFEQVADDLEVRVDFLIAELPTRSAERTIHA